MADYGFSCQVEQCKAALDQIQRREEAMKRYSINDELASQVVTASAIHPRLWDVISAEKLSFRKLRDLLDEVVPGIVQFPALNPEFAERIVTETHRFAAFRGTLPPDDAEALMHSPARRNVPLDCIGASIDACIQHCFLS